MMKLRHEMFLFFIYIEFANNENISYSGIFLEVAKVPGAYVFTLSLITLNHLDDDDDDDDGGRVVCFF